MRAKVFYKKWDGVNIERDSHLSEELDNDLRNLSGDSDCLFIGDEIIIAIASKNHNNVQANIVRITWVKPSINLEGKWHLKSVSRNGMQN